MQKNSNNNAPGWKQRLDEFEDTSCYELDREAAWEKLQQKKPVANPSYKKAWYWLAAACFSGFCILVADRIGQKPEQIKTFTVTKAAHPDPVKENTAITIKNTVAAIENKEEKKKQVIKINDQPLQDPVLAERDKKTEEPLLVKDHREEALVVSVDTILKPSMPLTTKTKKLKVVHINELYRQENSNGMVQQEGKPYFPITYKTKQVYTNADNSNNKTGKDNLIRIKLFP